MNILLDIPYILVAYALWISLFSKLLCKRYFLANVVHHAKGTRVQKLERDIGKY